MLLYRWIDAIALQVYRQNLVPHSDIRKMRYAMVVFTNEFIKLVLLFWIFQWLGYKQLFLFSFIVLVSIRVFAGGIHCESNIACFTFLFIQCYYFASIFQNYGLCNTSFDKYNKYSFDCLPCSSSFIPTTYSEYKTKKKGLNG